MSLGRGFPDLPPIWALGALALQFALDRFAPLVRFAFDALGWATLGVGLALIVWAAVWFRRKRTAIEPRETPTALIVEGPFRVNRNPIYAGMAICLVGTGVLFGSFSTLIAPAIFLWIVDRRFVRAEEAVLRAAFGPEADRFFAASRRW